MVVDATLVASIALAAMHSYKTRSNDDDDFRLDENVVENDDDDDENDDLRTRGGESINDRSNFDAQK